MKCSDTQFIEADLHCHSFACSHAYSTVNELAAAANKNGLKLFALTDHAVAMPDAPHIWHFTNLCVLPRVISGVTVLRGVEADIMNFDGELDMKGDDLKGLEWVVASCHLPCIKPGNIDENTNAYINAVKNNPEIDVIGHCTADRYEVDFDRIAMLCREYDIAAELNEASIQFGRSPQKNCLDFISACKKYGTKISVNTDCHYADLIGRVPIAEQMLSAFDFPDELIFNRNAEAVLEYVSKKRNINVTA